MFFRHRADGKVVPETFDPPTLSDPAPLSERKLTQLEETYTRLVEVVWNRGESFPKGPGNWIRLALSHNNQAFLELDSWQKALSLKTGSGEYLGPKLGFAGAKIENIGDLCFDFHCYISPARLEELLHLTLRVTASGRDARIL
jgi:hypothetical protein